VKDSARKQRTSSAAYENDASSQVAPTSGKASEIPLASRRRTAAGSGLDAKSAAETMRTRWLLALGVAVLAASCKDPLPGFSAATRTPGAGPNAVTMPEDCPASPEWFPVDLKAGRIGPTPSLADSGRLFQPVPHANTECPFYRGGLQNFLVAMYPDANHDPAIASYATVDDLFTKVTPLAPGALAPPGAHRGTSQRAWLGAIKQAGFRNILIDQNGHTLYYGIHVNQTFVDFIQQNNLTDLSHVKLADPYLFFPEGLVEYKSAWMDIDPRDGIDPSADFSTYVTTKAWVPTLHQDASTKAIIEDPDHPREIKVALIAIHSVYTLPGHPEFIWASIQHVNKGEGDLPSNQGADVGVTPNAAPAFQTNPSLTDPENRKVTSPIATGDPPGGKWLLYKTGTTARDANKAIQDKDLVLDEATQVFKNLDGSLAQTSIYRQFPGSKPNDVHPDDAVVSLNSNFARLVAQVIPNEAVGNYRLIGGQWLDKPYFFKLDSPLQNDDPRSNPMFALRSASDEMADPFSRTSQHDGDGTCIPGKDCTPANLGRLQILQNIPYQVPDGCDLSGRDLKDTSKFAAYDLFCHGSDSPFSILAGEDRMSSTSMESFTQSAIGGLRNCFGCHNTEAITSNGVPVAVDPGGGKVLMQPKLINVSHVFSEFVRDECNANPTVAMCN
jgi:hypothetical protein